MTTTATDPDELNTDNSVDGLDPEDARQADGNADTDVDHEPADPGDVAPDPGTDEVNVDGDEPEDDNGDGEGDDEGDGQDEGVPA